MIFIPDFQVYNFWFIYWWWSQCSAHLNPLLHSNQHTQCHTKDSGFYLYFFICYRHSQQQERNTGELGDRRLQKNKDFALLLISSLPPPSPSFAISFSFAFALLFSLQVFLFWPCAWEEREVTEKRERGRTNYFSTVLPSSHSCTSPHWQTKGQIHPTLCAGLRLADRWGSDCSLVARGPTVLAP